MRKILFFTFFALLALVGARAADVDNPQNNFVLLNVLTANNSTSLADTTSFTGLYDDYMLVFSNIVPVTTATGLTCQVRSGGTFQSSGYINSAGTSITSAWDISNSTTISNSATDGLTGTAMVFNINSTTVNKMLVARNIAFWQDGTGVINQTNGDGSWRGGQGALTGIQCFMNSGNISTGKIKIYGLRKAL